MSLEEINFIIDLIDLDFWKHSWHVDVYRADEITINNNLINILIKKIEKRNKEIQDLTEGLKILNSLVLKNDIITTKNSNHDDLPF